MTREDTRGYRPCVGMMALNREGLAWIGRRAGGPAQAEGPDPWWQMPQGGIDGGEDPAKAALRELREETGIKSARIIAETSSWLSYDLPEDLRDKAWEGRYRGQTQKWFAIRFVGPESEIDIRARDGHDAEFEAWRWAPLAELPGLIVPFKRAVYAAVVREFASFARPERE